MSFLKSKHSGWTHELKRTPFSGGGGGGDFFSGIGSAVSDAGSFIADNVLPIAATAAAIALAPETGGASLALDAELIAGADATAAGLGYSSAAEAISAGAASATELGLPAATTVADLGAVEGTASAGFVSSGAAPGVAGGVPTGADLATMGGAPAVSPAVAKTPEVLASQLGYSDPIAAIAGGVNPTDLGMVQAGTGGGLSDILGYAKTGAQVVGGLGQLAGGIGALTAGNRVGQLSKQADPFAQYRSGYAAQLQNLLQSPQTITSTPGYQFQLGQGLQAMQAQQAAQGRLVSGGGLLQAQQFGQQYATSNLQQQQSLLAQLSGATQSPASGATASAGLTAGALGGYLGGGQAIASGLGGIANPLGTLYANYNNPSPSVA